MHIKVTVRSVLRGKLLTSESPPFKTTCLCCWRLLYLLFYKAKICIWQQITFECSQQRKSIYNLLISLVVLRFNNNKGAREDFFFNYYYFNFSLSFGSLLSGGHFTQIKHATLLRPISIPGVCAYQSIGTVKPSRSLRSSWDLQSRFISGYWGTSLPCHIHSLDIHTRLLHK